jgi:hypothetical protein
VEELLVLLRYQLQMVELQEETPVQVEHSLPMLPAFPAAMALQEDLVVVLLLVLLR